MDLTEKLIEFLTLLLLLQPVEAQEINRIEFSNVSGVEMLVFKNIGGSKQIQLKLSPKQINEIRREKLRRVNLSKLKDHPVIGKLLVSAIGVSLPHYIRNNNEHPTTTCWTESAGKEVANICLTVSSSATERWQCMNGKCS